MQESIDNLRREAVQDDKNIDIWQRLDILEDHLEKIATRTYYIQITTIFGYLLIVVLLSILILG